VAVTDVGRENSFDDHELEAGHYFGERALLTGEPRAANVSALTTVTLLALDRTDFDTLLGPLRELIDFNLSVRVLKSVKLLQKLTEEEKERLVREFEQVSFAAGDYIVRQGEPGDSFYIIREGTAKAQQSTEGGEALVLGELKTGDYFGEVALLNDEPRNADVVADNDVQCFRLSREVFNRAIGPLQDVLQRAEHRRIATSQLLEQAALKASAGGMVAYEDLQELAVLGTGTFGRVKLVQHRHTKEVYALKCLVKAELVAAKQQANVINEKRVMLETNHPFILKLHTTYKDRYRLYMLLEFVQGGELFTVIHTPTYDGVPLGHARFYAAAVASAVADLHRRHIAYRDMKPENCMVDRQGYPKLVDFGFAKKITHKSYTLCGTPEYLAPELVLSRGHDKGVDYWALGVLLYEMVAGYSPFSDPENNDQGQIMRNIVTGKLRFPHGFSAAAKELCKRLLTRDPAMRLGNLRGGCGDILSHDFFADFDFDAQYRKEMPAPWVPKLKGQTDVSNFDPYELDDAFNSHQFVDTSSWDSEFAP